MASIVKKIINGRPYFYARVSRRVDGKPKIVSQTYLGSADKILADVQAAKAAARPVEASVRQFGAPAALLALARRLQLAEHIDRHAPQRGSGPSVGTCLLVAALNRCLAPCSKAGLARWFAGTVLPRLLRLQSRQLSSQLFRDYMDRIPLDAIPAIQRDVAAAMVREFDLDPRRLLFDATNFFTYADSFSDRPRLAPRGHSKEGRKSLRIVGVALLMTADFRLPLLHRTYPGNRPEPPMFASLAVDLARRCREIADGTRRVTLVLDQGNTCCENLERARQGPFRFIGSLAPTQHPDLLATPPDQLPSLAEEGLPGVRARRLRRVVFGVEHTVLVTWNAVLAEAQYRTLLCAIAQRRQHLRALQGRLRRWRRGRMRGGRKPTVAGTQKKVDGWLGAPHMRELFRVEVTKEEGLPKVRYRFQRRAWEQLQRTMLGKTLIVTDNHDWSDADLVRVYRAQHRAERAFRQARDTDCVAIQPQRHWTDQEIAVDVLCRVLAQALCGLLQRELDGRGVRRSIPALLRELGEIREVEVVYPPRREGGQPTIQTTLSKMTDEQRRIFDTLGLGDYTA